MRKEIEELLELWKDNKIGIRSLSEELSKVATKEEKLEAMKKALEV